MFAPFRYIIWFLMWICCVALAASFAGVLHPLGDSLSTFRPLMTMSLAALSALMLIFGGTLRAAFGLAVSGYCVWSLLPTTNSQSGDGESLTMYQKNLLFITSDTAKIETDIRSLSPDFVSLQEVSARNEALLDRLSDSYPNQSTCAFQDSGKVAILSKHPTQDQLNCDESDGLAAILIDTGRHRLWVASLHLRWPWPYGQKRHANAVQEKLSVLNAPIVVGGDFNSVPWSHTFKEFARFTGTELAGKAGGTLAITDLNISLPLDHVLVPAGARSTSVERRPKFTSDHNGVFAEFTLP